MIEQAVRKFMNALYGNPMQKPDEYEEANLYPIIYCLADLHIIVEDVAVHVSHKDSVTIFYVTVRNPSVLCKMLEAELDQAIAHLEADPVIHVITGITDLECIIIQWPIT